MTWSEDRLEPRLATRFRCVSSIGVAVLVGLAFPAMAVAFGVKPASHLSSLKPVEQVRGSRWARVGHRWVRNAPKLRAIVGGSPAPAGALPWLAYIQNAVGSQVFGCTGTVVAPNLILTAGHCAENITTGSVYPPGGYTVVTGSLDLTNTGARKLSGVSQVIVYPGFITTTVDGDAALLVLSTPTIAPAIALAAPGAAGLLATGSSDVIAGWGETVGGDTASAPTALQWATTVVQSAAYCASEFAAVPFDPLTEMCTINAPAYDTGTCFGDSGGPLIANDLVGESGTPTQIG